MTHNLRFAWLGAVLCTATAPLALGLSGPETSNATAVTSTSPVAYVYVSSLPKNSSADEIEGFAVAANGALTALPGSPFEENVRSMAVNGKYLFGADLNGIDIDSYRIEANGSLEYAAQTDIVQGQDCGNATTIFMDHTGGSVYNLDYDGSDCANTTYQAFAVNASNGSLSYVNEAGASPELEGALRFTGNNWFAYSASCYHFDPLIYGFGRAADGSLKQIDPNATLPTAASGENYCPYLAAADPTNHLAIAVQPMQDISTPAGAYQLATYTVGNNGVLSTGSTYANMPSVKVGTVMDLNMAPSGKLLAVAGTSGLQVFNFNGANPITVDTPLLTTAEIDQIFWDNNNHLFGISETTGKLYVFTVTGSAYSQAPGSPWTISNPQALIVQPLPLP